MTSSPDSPLLKHLDCNKDPRRHNTRHLLHDMFLIALCAIISGADSWVQVAEYGRSKIKWFKQFLELPNGIASHDTFGRLFAKIDPEGFNHFFTRWVQDLSESLKGTTVAIDGKTLRGSHDRINGKSAIHMVSAWAADMCLVLGQLMTDDKSNEITAIPELIKTLALQDAIVTIDAMGCQKKITRTIVDAGSEYVIQVKDNQKTFHENIAFFFRNLLIDLSTFLKPSMESTVASKPEATIQPAISTDFRERKTEQAPTPSAWPSGSGMSSVKLPLNHPISPASKTMLTLVLRP